MGERTEFHPDKCKMLRVTDKRKAINYKYHIHGHELENMSEAKYLEVTITNICHGSSTSRRLHQK